MTPFSEIVAAVSDNVRAELARHRKTQAELAEHLGITQQTLRSRLSGSPRSFDVVELGSIAHWLDIDVTRLTTVPPRTEATA